MYNQSLSRTRYTVSNQTLTIDYDFHTIEVTGGSLQMLYPEIDRKVKRLLRQKFTPKGIILQYRLSHPKVTPVK